MPPSDDYGGKPRNSEVYEMSKYVPPQTDGDYRVVEAPYEGFVDGIILGWPDGADQAVGVRIEDNESGEQHFPKGKDEFVAFNDLTRPFDVKFKVNSGDEIRAVFRNTKTHSVFVNCVPTIKQKFPGEDLSHLE